MAHKPREQDQIFDAHNGRPSYEAAPGILVLFKIYHVGYWLLKDETDIQTRLNHQQKSTQLVQNSSINPHYKKTNMTMSYRTQRNLHCRHCKHLQTSTNVL